MSYKPSDLTHISSLIMQCRPELEDKVVNFVFNHEWAEVELMNDTGKVIVTMETPSRFEVTEFIDEARKVEGVLNVVMVYHQVEDTDTLDDIIPNPPSANDPLQQQESN